jgi:hypothetical protein
MVPSGAGDTADGATDTDIAHEASGIANRKRDLYVIVITFQWQWHRPPGLCSSGGAGLARGPKARVTLK